MSNKLAIPEGHTILTPERVLEILFTDEVQTDDLQILAKATWERPGLARLGMATLGQPDPAAPNSQPVYSKTGAKIGFVAPSAEVEPPYQHTYLLLPEVER